MRWDTWVITCFVSFLIVTAILRRIRSRPVAVSGRRLVLDQALFPGAIVLLPGLWQYLVGTRQYGIDPILGTLGVLYFVLAITFCISLRRGWKNSDFFLVSGYGIETLSKALLRGCAEEGLVASLSDDGKSVSSDRVNFEIDHETAPGVRKVKFRPSSSRPLANSVIAAALLGPEAEERTLKEALNTPLVVMAVLAFTFGIPVAIILFAMR